MDDLAKRLRWALSNLVGENEVDALRQMKKFILENFPNTNDQELTINAIDILIQSENIDNYVTISKERYDELLKSERISLEKKEHDDVI